MKKLSINAPMKQYPLSLTERHVEMLAMFIAEKGLTSRSDAARHAISYAFEKCFPDYVYRLTPAGAVKAARAEATAAMDAVTDEGFVLSDDVRGAVYTDRSGARMAALHMIGNSYRVIPLEGAKAYLREFDVYLKDHRDAYAQKGSVEGSMSLYSKGLLLTEYGIDVDHQPDMNAVADEET